MLQAALIVLAAWYVFSPAVHGDWLWDDHEIRDNPALHEGLGGLGKIWVAPATADYYPIEGTVLWAEWHLWGDNVADYHAANIGLHLLSAFLIWRLLKKMGVRLAWLGGLLFVVHPLAVESVAWISEVKNTLSLPPLLLAMSAYIDYDGGVANGTKAAPRGKSYLRSLLWFLVAMLCKSSVVMFPAIILLYVWWRRGRIAWTDVRAAAGFFAIALLLGMVTVHFQASRAIRDWRAPAAGFPSRLGGAGLAIGFYFWKCVFPLEVMPIYPGWRVGATSPIAFVPWLILGALVAWLWTKRATNRGALFGLGCFGLNLVPVLGFVPMSYQHIAPVGDQLVYLPLVGIVGLAAAGISVAQALATAERSGDGSPPASPATAGGTPALLRIVTWIVVPIIVVALAVESHRYAGIFTDQETMWTYNSEHNFRSASVYSNLGFVLNRNGGVDEAVRSYEKAIQLDPEDPETENELAGVLADQNRTQEAIPHYERAIILYKKVLRADPGLHDINNKLGLDLAAVGRMDEAAEQFEEAVRRNPDSSEAHNNLAKVLVNAPGRLPEAISHFETAARLNPDSAMIQNNLGYALITADQPSEAVAHYEEALRIDPNYPGAHDSLGYAFARLGRFSEARSEFEEALRLKPDDADASSNLARLPAPQPGR
jgi:protein O-mannosyl-transferase